MTDIPLSAFLEADVRLLATAAGGRRQPIRSGYRCTCALSPVDHADHVYHDATFLLLGADRLAPGDTGRARIQPHFPDSWTAVEVGSRVEMCEGPRTVGVATIVELFPSRPDHAPR